MTYKMVENIFKKRQLWTMVTVNLRYTYYNKCFRLEENICIITIIILE